ncbi:hypothetical protein [Arthrobacter sp. ISL-48]|nr:hypothetical protein [Arthrobacter sp. ISL-48]
MSDAIARGLTQGMTGAALLSYAIGQLDARVTATTNPTDKRK